MLRADILQRHSRLIPERGRLILYERSDKPLSQAFGGCSLVLCRKSGLILLKFPVEGVHLPFEELGTEDRAYLHILLVDPDPGLAREDQQLAEHVAAAQVKTRIRLRVACIMRLADYLGESGRLSAVIRAEDVIQCT